MKHPPGRGEKPRLSIGRRSRADLSYALIAGFEEGATQLQRTLEALGEEDLSKVARHPRGLVPIGAWIGIRLNELVMHD